MPQSDDQPPLDHPLLDYAAELMGLLAPTVNTYSRVYVGKVRGKAAAILRVTTNEHIRCTIALTNELASCHEWDHGITTFDLGDPKSATEIIAWMIKVGLAQESAESV